MRIIKRFLNKHKRTKLILRNWLPDWLYHHIFRFHPEDIPGLIFLFDATEPHNVYTDIGMTQPPQVGDKVAVIAGNNPNGGFDLVQHDPDNRPTSGTCGLKSNASY